MSAGSVKVMLWLAGFLIAGLWSAGNFLLTLSLLRIALLKQDKARLKVFLLLKFPLFYLAGAVILFLRLFPVSGLLAGLLAGPAAVVIFKRWKKSSPI
jgi:hypothetical protein